MTVAGVQHRPKFPEVPEWTRATVQRRDATTASSHNTRRHATCEETEEERRAATTQCPSRGGARCRGRVRVRATREATLAEVVQEDVQGQGEGQERCIEAEHLGSLGEGQVPILIASGAGELADPGKVSSSVLPTPLQSLTSLRSYLWPGYNEQSSNHHVLLIVLLINAKRRERLETWSKWAGFSMIPRGQKEDADRCRSYLPRSAGRFLDFVPTYTLHEP